MKITVDAQQLQVACRLAAKLGNRTHQQFPMTRYAKITAEDGVIQFRVCDLEQMVWVKLTGEVDESGEMHMLYRPLLRYTRKEKGTVILHDIEPGSHYGQIESTHDGGAASLRVELLGNPTDAIPDWKFDADEVNLGPDAALWLGRSQTFAAKQESRPVLTSVLMEKDEDGVLTFIAADGFRLLVKNLADVEVPDGFAAMVPPRTCEIVGLFMNHGDLCAKVNDRYVSFGAMGIYLIAQTIQGTFPKYRALIPSDNTWAFEASAPLMAWRIDQYVPEGTSGIARFLIQENDTVKITLGEPGGGVTGDGPQLYAAIVPVTAREGAPDGKVAANPAFVLDALKWLSEVRFQGGDINKPFTLSGDVPQLRMVIMPMFVQW